MAPTIGEVQRMDLEIHQGADITFGFEWWADDQPVPLDACAGQVRESAREDAPLVVDLGVHATLVDNVCTVHVPANVTMMLTPNDRAVWDFFLTSANGETLPVGRGIAKVHRSVTQ